MTFNPEMLTLARNLRGWSKAKLAKATGISLKRLSSYEDKVDIVQASDIEKIATALHFPIVFFYQRGRLYPPDYCEHRIKDNKQ